MASFSSTMSTGRDPISVKMEKATFIKHNRAIVDFVVTLPLGDTIDISFPARLPDSLTLGTLDQQTYNELRNILSNLPEHLFNSWSR